MLYITELLELGLTVGLDRDRAFYVDKRRKGY